MKFPYISSRSMWLALMLLAIPALAVWMQPLPIAELTAQSQLVVHAKVADKVSEKDPEGRIYTRVQLQVVEVWKGVNTNSTITVFHGGGTVDGVRTEVSGQVEYEVGSEVVAFLVLNPRNELVTLGLSQGEFHVWKDKSGEAFAYNVFHGQPEGTTETSNQQSLVGTKTEKLTLQSLKQTVKGVAP